MIQSETPPMRVLRLRIGACADRESEYVPRLVQAAKQPLFPVVDFGRMGLKRKGNPGRMSPLPKG
jgi:hypothetical protein